MPPEELSSGRYAADLYSGRYTANFYRFPFQAAFGALRGASHCLSCRELLRPWEANERRMPRNGWDALQAFAFPDWGGLSWGFLWKGLRCRIGSLSTFS